MPDDVRHLHNVNRQMQLVEWQMPDDALHLPNAGWQMPDADTHLPEAGRQTPGADRQMHDADKPMPRPGGHEEITRRRRTGKPDAAWDRIRTGAMEIRTGGNAHCLVLRNQSRTACLDTGRNLRSRDEGPAAGTAI